MGIMGWFWGSSSPSSGSSDPFKNLDPSLREFLDKQSPAPSPPKPQEEKPSWVSQLGTQIPSQSQSPPPHMPEPSTEHIVPPQSLYQDGRYAHLWKNYRPLEEIEDAGKSTQDKIKDIYEIQESRKQALGRAALENCAFQQLAYSDCLNSGSVRARMTLCSAENRTLNRCIDMQAKFMKALGYLGVVGMGDVEAEERIQMHADRLYQKLIEQERLRDEARKEGRPIPEFEPVLNPQSVDSTTAVQSLLDPFDVSDLPKRYHQEYLKDVKDKSPQEAAVSKEALKAEIRQKKESAVGYIGALQVEQQQRAKRFEEGNPTLADRIKRLSGWDSSIKLRDVDPSQREG